MSILKWFLLPFSVIYWSITGIRNFLFACGIFKTTSFSLPIISVGNITVGGTGKTPHLELILSVLGTDFPQIATLSRGYKRATKGFLLHSPTVSARDIGDEPKQIAQKFPDVSVSVCEKRVHGIVKLQSLFPALQCIVLDDAYQHRYVQPSLSVLLVDYNRPIWNDFVFPAGMMREGFYARHRADICIVTKCPESFSEADAERCRRNLWLKDSVKLFFSKISYGQLVDLRTKKTAISLPKNISVLTGIAQHSAFVSFLRQTMNVVSEHHFADHHSFTETELLPLFTDAASKKHAIVLTEKDAVRLQESKTFSDFPAVQVYYMPIQPEILFGQSPEFAHLLCDHINQFAG